MARRWKVLGYAFFSRNRESFPTRGAKLFMVANMAKSKTTRSRQYSKKASSKVGRALHEMKKGELKSGRSGKKVKSRKQAIAIGLSEARKSGAKVPSR